MKFDQSLTSYTEIDSKWIKDLNVRPETMKLLEENIGSKPLDTILGNDVFGFDTKSKDNKSKNKLAGLHQIKKLCTAKETINKMKRQTTKWEKIFVNHISNEELTSKIYKELT